MNGSKNSPEKNPASPTSNLGMDFSEMDTPRTRKRKMARYFNLESLSVNDETNVRGKVVLMEDRRAKNEVMFRNIVLANDDFTTYTHLLAWGDDRTTFANSTSTLFLGSVPSSTNEAKFKSLLGKTLLLKNITVIARSEKLFDLGNSAFSLKFGSHSEVQLENGDQLSQDQQNDFLKFVMKKFQCEEFVIDNTRVNTSQQDFDMELRIVTVDDIRYRYYLGALQVVVGIKCENKNAKVELTGWNFFAFILRYICKNNEGCLIRFKSLTQYNSNIFFGHQSKYVVMPTPTLLSVPKKLADLVGSYGSVKVDLRLLVLTDVCQSASGFGRFSATVTDTSHKCILYTQEQLTFQADDEIAVSKAIIYWNGSVLGMCVHKEDVVVFDEIDNILDNEVDISKLTYPQKDV